MLDSEPPSLPTSLAPSPGGGKLRKSPNKAGAEVRDQTSDLDAALQSLKPQAQGEGGTKQEEESGDFSDWDEASSAVATPAKQGGTDTHAKQGGTDGGKVGDESLHSLMSDWDAASETSLPLPTSAKKLTMAGTGTNKDGIKHEITTPLATSAKDSNKEWKGGEEEEELEEIKFDESSV